jgi:predicted metal-binding membrane protein
MAGMGMATKPLSIAYLISAFAMWSVMMIAMMLPSAAPMILLHARVDSNSSVRAQLVHTLVFGLAYLLVWIVFSAAAATAQAVLVTSGAMSAAALALGTHGAAAALLLMAAAYELTWAKRRCLKNCQSPLVFIVRFWRPGTIGSLQLGIVHGFYCVGCCWALMLLLFAGGVMNLTWIVLLGVLVLGEKFAPYKWHAERFVALVLAAAGLALLAG